MKPNDNHPIRKRTILKSARSHRIPGFAIMHGHATGGCRKCPDLIQQTCHTLAHPPGPIWILCEHPDLSQLKSWRRRGLSIIDLSTFAQRLTPHINTSSTGDPCGRPPSQETS